MTNRPWMPMYWGDYLHDTYHLTAEQHGAYLLLIAYYWEHGRLPATVAERQAVSKISRHKWKNLWSVLAEFWLENGKHKRIDAEIERTENIIRKRKIAGQQGGLKSAGHTNYNRAIARANANIVAVANARANGPLTTVRIERKKEDQMSNPPGWEPTPQLLELINEQDRQRGVTRSSEATALPAGAPRSSAPIVSNSKPNGKPPHMSTKEELEAIYASKSQILAASPTDEPQPIPFDLPGEGQG